MACVILVYIIIIIPVGIHVCMLCMYVMDVQHHTYTHMYRYLYIYIYIYMYIWVIYTSITRASVLEYYFDDVIDLYYMCHILSSCSSCVKSWRSFKLLAWPPIRFPSSHACLNQNCLSLNCLSHNSYRTHILYYNISQDIMHHWGGGGRGRIGLG